MSSSSEIFIFRALIINIKCTCFNFCALIMLNQNQQGRGSSQGNYSDHNKIIQIEKELNALCCQHDSLMPLLEFSHYQNMLGKWWHSLKNINKKITEYQSRLDQFLTKNTNENISDIGQLEAPTSQQIGNLKINVNKVKQNFEQIKKKQSKQHNQKSRPQLVTQLLHSLYKDTNQNINKLKIETQTEINELKKYIQMSLALLKNQIMLNQMAQDNKLANSRNLSQYSNGQQRIIQKVEDSIFGELKKQLETLRSGFGDYELQDFHNKSFYRLSSQLMEINDLLEILYYDANFKLHSKTEVNFKYQQIQQLKQRIKLIDWQIRGLRKKYVSQLNYLLVTQNNQNLLSLQKLISADISNIQQSYSKIKDKFLQLQKLIQQFV